MKHIMISTRPEYVCKILNKEKLLEIRKSCPKEVLNGEECIVEMYCTKGNKNLYIPQEFCAFELDEFSKPYLAKEPILKDCDYLANGKVVAEFTLKTVNKFDIQGLEFYGMKDIIKEQSCLDDIQLADYIGNKVGYAWHIDDLKIYDKPKELSDFVVPATFEDNDYGLVDENNNFTYWKRVQCAPQSWCYVEGEK